MKKKSILAAAVLLALTVSVGMYAFTFTTNSTTLAQVSVGGAQIATSTTAAGQPYWDSLFPRSQDGLEILRPNAAGDVNNIPSQYPDSGEHWDKVADVAPDSFGTYIYNTTGGQRLDLYNLQDHAIGSGTIRGIAVYVRFTANEGGIAIAQPAIGTDGNAYLGAEFTQMGPNFATVSTQWLANPSNGKAWTWSDIDTLQAGVSLRKTGGNNTAVCTQVYVVVTYTEPPITQGSVPAGNLYVITPHPAYTGDLAVKLYLTNTGALTKAYRYLILKLYLGGSIEAGQTPNYQLLTLENGVASFNIVGGASANYTLQVTGGSYSLLSGDANQWPVGWSLTPEIYNEVTTR